MGEEIGEKEARGRYQALGRQPNRVEEGAGRTKAKTKIEGVKRIE